MTKKLRLGLVLGSDRPGWVERAQRAEELGFAYLGTGEHMMFHGPTGNALITLAAMAGVTNSVELVSTITLVPLYSPVVLAKMAANLDRLSNGRFILGVGIGGEFPTEFDACGVPVTERGARTNEALDLITKLWSGERMSYEGRFTRFTDGRLQPTPNDRPGEARPPIWVSGRKEAAMRRAARFGNAWLPYMYTPEQVASSSATVGAYARELGRPEPSTAVFAFTTMYADGEKARRIAAERVGGTYNQDFSKLGRYLIAGTPAECRRRVEEYADAGAEHIILAPACPADDVAAMMEDFAAELIG